MGLYKEFCNEILEDQQLIGDVIEFGTGSGYSVDLINKYLKETKKIFTIDGFQGLPKTKKVIPRASNWYEGNMRFEYQEIAKKLNEYKNIEIIKSMTFNLKNPEYYNIKKISGVNIDLDLYESTVDALDFVDKCEWENIILRFDDWGAHIFQIQEEYDQHEKAAFYEFVNKKKYKYYIYDYRCEYDLVKLIKIQR